MAHGTRRLRLATAAATLALVATGASAQPAAPNPTAPPAPAAPANEPGAVAAFRALLGDGVRLRYAEAVPDRPDRVRLLRAEVESGGQTLRADELTLEGARRDGFARLAATGLRLDGASARAASLEVAGFALAPGPFHPNALSLDRVALDGLEVEQDDGTLGARRVAATGYGPGREFALDAEGLFAAVRDGAPVGRVEARRVSLAASDLAAQLGAVYDTLSAPPAQPPAPVEGWARLAIEGVDVMGARERASDRLGGVESVELRSENPPAGGAAHSLLRVTNIELTERSPFGGFLETLGYRGLRADLVLDSSQNEATGRFEIGAAALAVREAGALGLSLALDGASQSALLQGLDGLAFVSARVRYADQSLLERALRQRARERGVPVQTIRREWEREIGQALADPPRQRGALAPVRDPILRLVRGQARELEIAANPPQPIRMEALGKLPDDPLGWQRFLGVTVTAR